MNLKKLARYTGLAFLATASASSFAADVPTNVQGLAAAVSFTDVSLAILAIAGAMITLAVTTRGARMVMNFIGR